MTNRSADDPTEARLRAALDATADRALTSPDALQRIEDQLMQTPSRKAWLIGGGALAAALLLVVGFVAFGGDDPDPSVVAEGPSTSTTSPTTTSPSTTETTVFTPTTDPSIVVFPAIDSSRRFDTPEAVAFSFATEYAEFTDPQISDFRAGDSRSGEFEVTRNGRGPVSTILVRQLDDDSWGVIGAEHDGITPSTPASDASISSPVALRGVGLAFEGTINVSIREQGRTADLGAGFVTASGTPPAGPYEDSLDFQGPSTEFGAVVYREFSAEDGTTSWISVTRVRFGTSGCPESAQAAAGEVLVFFACESANSPIADVGVPRSAGGSSAVLGAALEALLAGPTDDERASGLVSPFPVDDAEVLGVTIDAEGASATIDLSGEVEDALPNSSFSIVLLRSTLFNTATQFDSVEVIEVLFDGSCQAFAEWSQSDDCLVTSAS